MTPGARVAAAIAVVDAWAGGAEGLDRVLAAWGRANRYAGSGDRRAIADLAYDAVRRLRSALWVAGWPEDGQPADGQPADAQAAEGAGPSGIVPAHPARPGRRALIGSLRLDGADPAALFTGDGHAPPPLAEGEAPARALGEAPRGVRLDLPDWLLVPGTARLAEVAEDDLARLRQRASVFLRANALKATAGQAVAALAEDGVEAEPGPLSAHCLRVVAGARRVARSRAYREGLVEIQDAASQAVAALCAARPGERVLDLCAGGGGKTLALAAAMGNRGDLWAHDAAAGRLAQLPSRAGRAGARVRLAEADALPRECDLVLVDAPCSGSGAWARNPDAKWRLGPAGLDGLRATQAGLLARALGLVREGGRVVYATCSLMPAENREIVAGCAAAALETERSFRPSEGGDGFYAAVLRRR